MNIRGVVVDTGIVFGRGPIAVKSVPAFDPRQFRRELEIIRDDLHCDAVRIRGQNTDRLIASARDALRLGLQVWLSPELFDRGPRETLRHIGNAAAQAEELRREVPGRLVLSVGSELTLFMRGVVPGGSLNKRMAGLRGSFATRSYLPPLEDYLARARESVRAVFHGEITYAALPFETIDWGPFDLIGLDHYREDRVKDRYTQMLEPLQATGKPVVITEVGMRGYQGAASSGALGVGIADGVSVLLHQIPVVGRLVRPRLQPGQHVRDEAMQASELVETLEILENAGVEGAFVAGFSEPMSPYSDDPRHDLDMSALSLVKTYTDRRGKTYPDMPWEPKESFRAVAAFYAGHAGV
jgi:hypothetical protein